MIANDTVNTMPPATMDAFRDHGKVADSLDTGIDEAEQVMERLAVAGISIDAGIRVEMELESLWT